MVKFNRQEEPIEMYKTLLWMNPNIQYVFGKNIVEYDMQSASLSVSRRFKLIPDDRLDILERMPKDKRTKAVGLMQRDDKVFSENMINGLLQTRKEFLQLNHLDEETIVTLHSDAIMFIQTKPVIDRIECVPFIHKNTWTSYMRYGNLEMFYGDGEITYKGIPKQMLQQHTLGICQFLLTFFQKVENGDESIYEDICVLEKKYLTGKVPEYYYISFGTTGPYKAENLKLFGFLAQIIQKEVRLT